MSEDVERIRKTAVPILKKHRVKRAGVFGSHADGSATSDSDIDLLVEIEADVSLLDIVGLKLELEEAFRKKVDLVEYGAIKPILKDRILGEETPIL